MRHAVKHRRTAATAPEEDVPLLVRVLAGNLVTSAHILACLNTADARHLRRLQPAVSAVVAGVPWCDTDTPVVDTVRWRTCFPAAVGVKLAERAAKGLLASAPAVAALDGLTVLVVVECADVTDDLLLRLPTSLHTLNARNSYSLTADASFAHLTALTSLASSETKVVIERTDGLPPSLQVLDISGARALWPGASLAHLRQLRVLRANRSRLDTRTLASLPNTLEELHAECCRELTPVASFAYLTALRKLDVSYSAIGDASLTTLPPSLVSLNACGCKNLTVTAALPALPALQLLDVSGTDIGDALVAILPATLVELWLSGCRRVTASARLDHLHALRVLHCTNTELSPAALAVCRERGCVVVAASALRGHNGVVESLALLPGGMLASGDVVGTVRLWDTARSSEATAVLEGHDGQVRALAVLSDGCRLAASVSFFPGIDGAIVVWDTGVVPPTRRAAFNFGSGVWALAVLCDGRLAAGCSDGGVRLVEVCAAACSVSATLEGHTSRVAALAVLPDGTLASGSDDTTMRLWDVGALVCVATLGGHTGSVHALAVLADGRLASGSEDRSVRLWDVATRACVGVLEGHADTVYRYGLAALPDGRLASGSGDPTIRVWDTRPVAAAGTAGAAGGGGTRATPVVVLEGHTEDVCSLVSLPGGRLASGSRDHTVRLWCLPPL